MRLVTVEAPAPAAEDMTAALRAAEAERRVIRARLRPPPKLTVSEWADRFRVLSPEASARPGRFATDDAPYQREPMDAIGDPAINRVVLMWASQLGKTEVLNNAVGYFIDQQPAPILVIQPTGEMAEAWSKDRLSPMLRDTPCLRGKVRDARSRDSGNTIKHKQFPGGHITMAGSESPAGLASRPIRILLPDEVDRFPPSAGAEGSPLALAEQRTVTFTPYQKIIPTSTPTIKGASVIEYEYERSDQRRFYVPCPHCDAMQLLAFGGRDTHHGLKWEPGQPDTAHYVCVACGCVIEETEKRAMLARGEWRAQYPERRVRGYWLNALYSPWFPWSGIVERWLREKDDPMKLRTFVNVVLCECWEDEGTSVDAGSLASRREPHAVGTVPARAAVLTRSVDVQGDRLETAVWAWGEKEEAWLVEHELIPGDPGTPAPWAALDEIRARTYRHAGGRELRPAVTFIDSGGHHTQQVYAYTRPRVSQRVFAIKGSSLEGAPLLKAPTRNNSAKALLYMVGSFTGKEAALSRFAKVREPGPAYIHLPEWLDVEQVHQFTNERLVTRIVGGRPKREWVKVGSGRNEQLDLLVYAMAALHVLGPVYTRDLGRHAAKLMEGAQGAEVAVPVPVPDAAPDADGEAAPVAPAPPLPRPVVSRPVARPRGAGFVKRW